MVRCSGECICNETVLNGTWAQHTSQTDVAAIPTWPPTRQCTLNVSVAHTTHGPSHKPTSYKVKLIALAVGVVKIVAPHAWPSESGVFG